MMADTDARQALRERIENELLHNLRHLHEQSEAIVALLDEPTLLSLLGLRQVGGRNNGVLHDFDPQCLEDPPCEPIYAKEAPLMTEHSGEIAAPRSPIEWDDTDTLNDIDPLGQEH